VTPNEDNEHTCVFVGDPAMVGNPGEGFVPSRYQNLCGETFVDEYIRCAAAVARHEDIVRATHLRVADPPEMAMMRRALAQIAELEQRLRASRK
jgi:hypothetical protein